MTTVNECRDNDSPWLLCKTCVAAGFCKNELSALRAERDALHKALTDLVYCKDMKDRLSRLHAMGHGTDFTDYYRLRPLAWDAARAALKGE